MAQAVAWQENLGKFRALGYELALVSYDKPDVVKKFAERRNITYPMLSDVGSKAILAFGLTEAEGSRKSRWWGIAEPAIFVVGKSGKITHRFLDPDIAHSPDPAPVLDALKTGS